MIDVAGLDLSLTSTGIARINGHAVTADRIIAKKTSSYERLSQIRREVLSRVTGARLVVVEGPSFGSAKGQRGHHERGGLWWLITYELWLARQPFAVVPPANLKRYATGKGMASKDQVLAAAIRRYPNVPVDGNDQADALILAAMGADHLGQPIAFVPASHRIALAAVPWPPRSAPLLREEAQ